MIRNFRSITWQRRYCYLKIQFDSKMAMLTRLLTSRQLLKYVVPHKSLMLVGRPMALKASEYIEPKREGHDERNMRLGRPMSPHLSIYKPQLTSFLSISHRATGMALAFYLMMISFGSVILSQPIPYYLEGLQNIGWFTHFVLKMFVAFPFAYHYINGVRHLAWDMGKLLTIKEVYSSGYAMVGSASVLAVLLAI